ncbi:MAG: flagellar hook-basal body complex protein FliE [Pyrinomonadaceae bacterium]
MQIGNITPTTPLTGGLTSTRGISGGADGFGSAIKDAVESIDQTQKSAEDEISKAVTGDSPDLHKTIIALQTADLKFQLGLQVRNKLIGAFDEVMRMPV